MLRSARRLGAAFFALLFTTSQLRAVEPSVPAAWSTLAAAMRQELSRSLTTLSESGDPAPYYLGYWLIEVEQVHVEARYGSVVRSDTTRTRLLRTELRVGSMDLDNSNYFSGASTSGPLGFGVPMERAPLDSNTLALRRSLWLLTDDAYQNAIELLDQKRAERQSTVKQAATAADFSNATLTSLMGAEVPALPARGTLEDSAIAASRVFVGKPDVHDATVVLDAWTTRRMFVTAGGVESYEPTRYVRHSVQGYTQADDGMPLSRTETRWGELDARALTQAAEEVANDLAEQRRAPVAADYSGPVLFEAEAAAQLAYELLGEAVSGTPSADGVESPWLRRLGKRVLPTTIDVFDDPTIANYRGEPLSGGYLFDDEGVRSQRVELVERGRLRALLMSRTPNEHVTQSNGHGRAGVGGWSRGAIGNLVVAPRKGHSGAELRRKLLAQVREEGADYGIVVQAFEPRDFSSLGAAPPRPERVIRLYLNGREEVVRGAELFEIGPRALKDILATGQTASVHTITQLSAGSVPTAASIASPALLFEDVEIRRPSAAHELPPVLPRRTLAH